MANYYNLVEELNKASESYYNGNEILSNFEYDSKYDILRRMEAESGIIADNSPTKKVGAPVSGDLPKFKHTYPALSLDKTKDVNELKQKFQNGILQSGDPDNDAVVVMWKLDGSTVQAYYKDGKLQNLVTRGNGEIGSDITHNAKALGVPLRISAKGEVVVRGEALMSYLDFNKINATLPADQQYKNPRNLAAASISLLDPSETKERHVVVKMFNLVKYDPELITECSIAFSDTSGRVGDRYSFANRLSAMELMGFNVVERHVCSVDEVDSVIAKMSEQTSTYDYPVDGLVVAMDNYAYASTLEGTEHHPNIMQGYAFKWADEVAETTIRNIEWSPSRTGLLNPVAIFDPVELEGTTVQRCSLHNVSVFKQFNIRIGDKVEIFKSNKIIPQCARNLDAESHDKWTNDELLNFIGSCSTCETHSVIRTSSEGIETAYCPNPNCLEKMIGKLAHFCSRDCMDIQGMSEETIKKLVDAGFIKEYADFFQLDNKPGISFLPGFGKQSWVNMCKSAKSSRKTNFVKFITALSITDIGKGQAKTLYRYISDNYDDLASRYFSSVEEYKPVQLFRLMCLQDFDFSIIEGFGKITSDGMIRWAHEHWEIDSPEERVLSVLAFVDERSTNTLAHSVLSGKSFCITGKLNHFKNRQDLVDWIESLGGKWVDSVSKNTDYLINNDITSTSGKNKKARELGVKIISEQDFLSLV